MGQGQFRQSAVHEEGWELGLARESVEVVDEADAARRSGDVADESRWDTDLTNKASMVRWGGAGHMGCQ